VTARDSDRDVQLPSSGGHFESSIYPVEHGAGAWEVGDADLGAEGIGSPAEMTGIVVVRCHSTLHERVDDAPHALSPEPSALGLDR
jgi:hypothetical protein